MSATVKDSTTLAYNDDETILTVLVENKPIAKFKFILHDNNQGKEEHPCNRCAFEGLDCEEVKCLWDQRKDVNDGHYEVIDDIASVEPHHALMNACRKFVNELVKSENSNSK